MSELPREEIENIVSLVTDKTTGQKDPTKPYLGLEHLPSRGSSVLGMSPAEDSVSINNKFRAGDILFGKLRPRLRKSVRVDFDGYCSTDMLVLRATKEAHPPFAGFVLQSDAVFSEAIRTEEGTKMPRCSWGTLRNLRVFCPDSGQQQRIAEVLAKVDEVIEQTEVLIAKTQQIKAGLMHDLFTRGVTADGQLRPPRAEAPQLYKQSPLGWIPKEWETLTLGRCLTAIDAGHSPECPDTPAKGDQWGVLKVGAVDPAGLKEEQNKTVPDAKLHDPSLLVRSGDLLLSRANTFDLVGLVCHVEAGPHNVMLSDKTLRLRVDLSHVHVRFLFWILQLRAVRRQIESAATGTSGSMKNISQQSVRALRLGRPDLEEQARLVERMDAAASIGIALRQDAAKLSRLKQGLMHDLLTGRVRVPVAEAQKVAANRGAP